MKNRIPILVILAFFLSPLSGQDDFYIRLARAAEELTRQQVVYDPAYYKISYPNGDIPPDKGVCTDVIIRAYRKMGIDLQKEIHEDMTVNLDRYPDLWGMNKTDPNIDHRRVPNLMTYFMRKGESKRISTDPTGYLTGDIVAWDLGGGITHIGILIDKRSKDDKRNLVVHNIGQGQEISDCLFSFRIIGHYRYK